MVVMRTVTAFLHQQFQPFYAVQRNRTFFGSIAHLDYSTGPQLRTVAYHDELGRILALQYFIIQTYLGGKTGCPTIQLDSHLADRVSSHSTFKGLSTNGKFPPVNRLVLHRHAISLSHGCQIQIVQPYSLRLGTGSHRICQYQTGNNQKSFSLHTLGHVSVNYFCA